MVPIIESDGGFVNKKTRRTERGCRQSVAPCRCRQPRIDSAALHCFRRFTHVAARAQAYRDAFNSGSTLTQKVAPRLFKSADALPSAAAREEACRDAIRNSRSGRVLAEQALTKLRELQQPLEIPSAPSQEIAAFVERFAKRGLT